MLNVDQLVAQFGAYYIPGGQSVANLKKALYAASETAALFNDRPMMGDYFRGSKVTMGNVLQPFQKAFTPSGCWAVLAIPDDACTGGYFRGVFVPVPSARSDGVCLGWCCFVSPLSSRR